MEEIKLYNYQKEFVKKIQQSFLQKNSVLLQMPTGTGKTIVISEIVRLFLEEHSSGENVLVLSHRRELNDQLKKHIGERSYRTIKKEERIVRPKVRIATVQSQVRKLEDSFLKSVGLIIIDEAHHTPAATYKKVLKASINNKTMLLGVTATPKRLDGKKLSKYFKTLIDSLGIKWYIDNKYLSHIEHYASLSLDRRELLNLKRDVTGDYDPKEIEKLFLKYKKNHSLIADLIESYQIHSPGKKCIVYAATQKHAEEICNRYKKEGISSQYITSKMKTREREKVVADFRSNKFKVLVNVEIFTEGFDCRDVEVVQFARPTKSLVKYLQMAGRVTRIHPGKKCGIILDNVRLWEEHGKVTFDRNWKETWENGEIDKDNEDSKSFYKIIQKESSKLFSGYFEIEGMDLEKVDDTNEEDGNEYIVDIRVYSVIHDKRNTMKTHNDFIGFFEFYLPDWNKRIGYKGGNLMNFKITKRMYDLIIKHGNSNDWRNP